MPSGKSFSLEFRMLVFRNHVQHGYSAEWILKHCFAPDPNNMQNITLKYLKSLCNKLSSSPEFAQDYLLGAKAYRKSGRPLKISLLQEGIIMDLLKNHKRIQLKSLRKLYYEFYYGVQNPENLNLRISTQSVSQVIKRANWTMKESEYRHVNYDINAANAFLVRVAHIDPMSWVDIDESGSEADCFGTGKGYAPVGEKFMRTQFVVRGKHHTIIAAATPLGFLSHRIFLEGVNDQAFIEFMDSLVPLISPEQVGLLDNAAIHRTEDTRVTLEAAFHGNYHFCSPYSPHLKPVEKCFSLVKRYISYLESSTPYDFADTVGLIHNAFMQFRIGGPQADSIMGNWNDYFVLHNHYLNGSL